MNELNMKGKVVWFLNIILIASFTILESYTWGKYVFFVVIAAIYFIYYLKTKELYFPFSEYQKFIFIFAIYTLLSSIWALKASDSISMGITLLEIGICFSLVFICYQKCFNVYSLIRAIKWSGVIVAIYTFGYYGISRILQASISINSRLENDFSNVNTIGLICAVSGMILIYEFFNEKKRWQIVLLIPLIMVITATQSRKALVFLVIVCIWMALFQKPDNKIGLKYFIRISVALIVLCIIIRVVSQLDMFSAINERMSAMLSIFVRNGMVDGSTELRNILVQYGIKWWSKNPIIGIGIGNTHILVNSVVGHDYYLHNNYVELLAGGGIVGFAIYYSMYLYLVFNLIKYRHNNMKLFSLEFIWIFLMLFLDYGMVSYYSKLQWYFLLVHFLAVRSLKGRKLLYE